MGTAEAVINPFSPEHHKQLKEAEKDMIFTSKRSQSPDYL